MLKCKDGTLNWNRTSSCQNAGLWTKDRCKGYCKGRLQQHGHSAQLDKMSKNPPKMRFKKFVKLTDHTHACNNIARNGSYVNLQKLGKTREITNFWRIFGLLEPLCHSGQRPGQAACTDFRQRPEQQQLRDLLPSKDHVPNQVSHSLC